MLRYVDEWGTGDDQCRLTAAAFDTDSVRGSCGNRIGDSGNAAGGLAVLIYVFFTNWGLSREGGEINTWIPFLNGILEFLWFHIVPEFVRGAVAMGSAVGLTLFVFKRANSDIVAYSTVSVYAVVGVILIVYLWINVGFRIELFDTLALMVGFAFGAFSGRAFLE